MARNAKIDWDAAFAFFAGLGPTRSLPQVAREFDVTLRTVARHAARENWRQRAAAIDAQARERAESKVIRARSERLQDSIRLIDAARIKFARQLARSDYEVKAGDFAALVKLETLLEGEVTERVEVSQVTVAFKELIGLAVRFIPDERQDDFLQACETSLKAADDIPQVA